VRNRGVCACITLFAAFIATSRASADAPLRAVRTACFNAELPPDFRLESREHTSAQRPSLGRWRFAAGPVRLTLACGAIGARAPREVVSELLRRDSAKVAKWRVEKEGGSSEQSGREVAYGVAQGTLGGERFLFAVVLSRHVARDLDMIARVRVPVAMDKRLAEILHQLGALEASRVVDTRALEVDRVGLSKAVDAVGGTAAPGSEGSLRWFGTKCLAFRMPDDFEQTRREKPNPWKPWLGRWGYARGPLQVHLRCDALDHRPFGAVVRESLGRLERRVFTPRVVHEAIAGPGAPERAIVSGRGRSNDAPAIFARIVGAWPEAGLLVEATVVAPEAMTPAWAALVRELASSLSIITAREKSRLEAHVRGK
jgi:hypothetical protein